MTPVHKKDDKQKIKNYRPISLLLIWAKLFERILFNNIYNYLISNNLITTNQSGFKPDDPTTNQLLYLTHIIHSSFDLNMSREVRHIFLDMAKTFDKVWHEGLLFKLKQNGISGQILNLLTSHLDKRKQRVLLNGCESHWAIVESGVPQCSWTKISIGRKGTGIGIIKYMSSYAPTKTLDKIYKIFVRPYMDYCDIIYHLPRSTSAFDCPINLNFMM